MRMHQPLQPLQRGFEHHPLQTGFDQPPPKQDSITDSQPPNGIRPTPTQTGFDQPPPKQDSITDSQPPNGIRPTSTPNGIRPTPYPNMIPSHTPNVGTINTHLKQDSITDSKIQTGFDYHTPNGDSTTTSDHSPTILLKQINIVHMINA